MQMPTITTKKGLTIANFSSPHQFLFDDGSILPGCSPERSKALMLHPIEKETVNPKGFTDIELKFEMSGEVRKALSESLNSKIDIVIVPLPVMVALKEADIGEASNLPFRTCRVKDRVTKEVYSNRFCI